MSTLGLASAHRTAHVAPRGANLRRPSAAKRRAPPPLSQRRPRAVAVDASVDSRTQADFDALWAWLGSEGVDVSKVSRRLGRRSRRPGRRGGYDSSPPRTSAAANADARDPAICGRTGSGRVGGPPRSRRLGSVRTTWTRRRGCAIAVALELHHEMPSRRAADKLVRHGQEDVTLAAERSTRRAGPVLERGWSARTLTGTQLLDASGGDTHVRGRGCRIEGGGRRHPHGRADAGRAASNACAFGIESSRARRKSTRAPTSRSRSARLDMANHSGLSSMFSAVEQRRLDRGCSGGAAVALRSSARREGRQPSSPGRGGVHELRPTEDR